jgi:hypothetical protein
MSDDDGIPFEQFRERIIRSMGDDCLGYFDLISGTIAVNFSSGGYKRAMQHSGPDRATELPADDRHFVETCLHEYFHYLQLLGSGFLFEISRALFGRILEVSNGVKEITDETIREFAKVTEPIFAKLLNPGGESGLTALDLIEGSAFLFGARMAGRATDPEGLLEKLESPDLEHEYRSAYLYTHEHLGDDAYKSLIYLTGIALIHERPVPVYESLVAGIGRVGMSHAGDIIKGVMTEFADSQIGGALEVWQDGGAPKLEWYSSQLKAMNEHPIGVVPIFFELEQEVVEIVGSPTLIATDVNSTESPVQLLMAVMSADLSASPTLPFRSRISEL